MPMEDSEEPRAGLRHTTLTPKTITESSERTPRTGGRRNGAGGHRLAVAFEAVSELPALADARRRLVRACEQGMPSTGEMIAAVESDAALAIALMRAANNGDGPPGRAAAVGEAIAELTPEGVYAIASSIDTYDAFERPGLWAHRHERFRRHGIAVRQAVERIADVCRLPDSDELALAALLHDVGRLVLAELYGDEYGPDGHRDGPDERMRRERRELGIDHALVGAVLVRRWGLPQSIASVVERHHAPDADGGAAAVRLGDLLVHHCNGEPVPSETIRTVASGLGIDDKRLRDLIFEFPYATRPRRREAEPCPLSTREVDALRGLAEGKVYKQIAQELQLSVSTVRTHLHNVYRKIGAVDRAQAVLIARDRGWL
jgi:putative nucleotidyltransferase with HDIG domain